jgi:hypothetical protein
MSIETHDGQQLHGFPFIGDSQFTAFERILAQVVFPVPREPQNK